MSGSATDGLSIGELQPATTISGGDIVPLTQGYTGPGTGLTKSATVSQLAGGLAPAAGTNINITGGSTINVDDSVVLQGSLTILGNTAALVLPNAAAVVISHGSVHAGDSLTVGGNLIANDTEGVFNTSSFIVNSGSLGFILNGPVGSIFAGPTSNTLGGDWNLPGTFNAQVLQQNSAAVLSGLVAGTGLSGGTLTSGGTIALATRTAHTLMGNPGSVAATPSDITVGTSLTLTATGTLNFTGSVGTGTVTQVVGAAPLSGGTITTSGTLGLNTGAGLHVTSSTLVADWNGGTVTALGGALKINSGTLSEQNQGTITLSGTTTGTISPANIDSALVNVGTAAGTIAVSPGFQGQRLRVEIKQGATAQTVSFTSTVSFGATVTSYTATAVANARDLIQLFCVDGTHWAFAAVSQGFTI